MNRILQEHGKTQKEKAAKKEALRKAELNEFCRKLSDKATFCFFIRNGVKYFGRIHPEKGDVRVEDYENK